ncbi:MAG: toprim domain-containing protein [Nitratireductor sp.]
MKGPDLGEIRERLIDRIDSLVRELAPDGRASGSYWIAKNPTRTDRHAGSFWVRIRQPAAGAWRDEAGVRGVDEGDVVDLVRYCLGHRDLSQTRAWCLRWLGLAPGQAMTAAERAERDRQRAAARAAAEAEEAERRRKNARGALAMWLDAPKLMADRYPGSLIDRYLCSRAIDLAAGLLARRRELPGALRFLASHDYRTLDGELIALPCMIALMSGPDGRARAVHRTWLQPDGSGKATLPDPKHNKPRKIWPAGWAGAVVRIAKGAGGHSPEEAARRGLSGPLVVTEGIEDALAVMLAMPERRVWAAGTLGNIAHVPVDHPAVSSVTVCRDNDWDKKQAVQSFERAIAALRRHGKPVHVARSPRGKDMNDLLKGATI